MAKVLSITGGVVELAIPFFDNRYASTHFDPRNGDPCKQCEFQGLCSDDCGQHLFDLDTPDDWDALGVTWEDWLFAED